MIWKVHNDGRKASVTSIFKKTVWEAVSFALMGGKVRKSSWTAEKAAVGTSQHGLSKSKLRLTNQIARYGRRAGAVDEESTVDVIYRNCHKTFNHHTIFHATSGGSVWNQTGKNQVGWLGSRG